MHLCPWSEDSMIQMQLHKMDGVMGKGKCICMHLGDLPVSFYPRTLIPCVLLLEEEVVE